MLHWLPTYEINGKHKILIIVEWMELILTALIKAIILYWGRGGSSGDEQLETHQNVKQIQNSLAPRPLPLSM